MRRAPLHPRPGSSRLREDFFPCISYMPITANISSALQPLICITQHAASSTGRIGPAAHALTQKVPAAAGRRSPALFTAQVEKGHNQRAEDAQSRQPRAALNAALSPPSSPSRAPARATADGGQTQPRVTPGPALRDGASSPVRMDGAAPGTPRHSTGSSASPRGYRGTVPPVLPVQGPGTAELQPRGSADGSIHGRCCPGL